jgi:hypothetical protein
MFASIKAGLDLVIKALDWFPGLKRRAGAVLQVVGTLMLAYNSYGAAFTGVEVPVDLVVAVNAAAATLIAVGVAAPEART